ncbi:O-antigen/teichoic acid export membrane protein [Clostridium saccharoperbutylacetonicum]|uniref:Membrane protein involved in the export of O-antigen and teichoic acid n=1 Tax=Clostridium saccharoperbutylacetonicum N1-4(HMT) TaxID=931276 RepID=M1MY68_9CLOT|nr:oligosaccharide flippase family protein [Clostridium saccharoperbutylacetonicum]AGF56347.1 membrane protein involved in the export of O-antigen and teichoic acid [Clostridium saccharoperbutylacetonicum N1-4(HMT)]NRT62909.1 O-antigen/teichoic acid export membrane protein [Clostridium saccharoperbutylacetonicum]NSB26265.1 O-antigen/teichoic acid export membrane protein [Clostridium saccharoperbutylacetonicum]NSB45617.1 O-antigen/teichoic acid export membrane protein [Clostridium saccharoperbut
MNNRVKEIIKNIIYIVTANGIGMIISALITLIVPKFLGVKEYGYWQLYTLYISYVGFFAFGWCDGIYLRFGGYKYEDLEKETFVSQFWLLTIFQVFLSLLLFIAAIFLIKDSNKQYVAYMTILCGFVTIIKSFVLLILQATNRIREFAKYTRLNQYIYIVITMAALFLGIRSFEILLIIDIISKFIVLILCFKCCKEVIWGTFAPLVCAMAEAKMNINAGIKLMLANIASSLIIGIVRIGIERKWDIFVFGKLSLTLSISNLLVSFINAIGVVMYPILRRMPRDKLPSMYTALRTLLMSVLLLVLASYYPLKVIMSMWLPNYADSLIYMAILFPMCIYESHMALLINTYLKTLRKEAVMLYINVLSVVASLILTSAIVLFFNNLNLLVFLIVALIAFRCIIAELYISRIMGIRVGKDMVIESVMSIAFITLAWFSSCVIGFMIYIIFYVIYISIKKKDIMEKLSTLKTTIWSEQKEVSSLI